MNGLDLVYILGGLLSAPLWARKRRAGWGERFGKVAPMLGSEPAFDRPRVMLHAVSVGEVNALRPLVPRLTPEASVIVSTTTDTGLARARALFAESCEVVRYPLDFSWAVGRFLDLVRPDVVGLVELELWPNFLRGCRRRGVPVCVINGRLSERSFKGYRRFRGVVGGMFRSLAFAGVQDPSYRERFLAMGVAPERCAVTGSMKWDSWDVSGEGARPSPEAVALGAALGIDPDRPLGVGGSTAPGEEALLRASCPAGAQLACAPRKPERFEEAWEALRPCARRSEGRARPGDRFLLDTIGELGLLYQLADVAVVGRSFGDLHGSDPIEPVALGAPTLIGPRFGDFEHIVGTLRGAGGLEVVTREALAGRLAGLLEDERGRSALRARGREAIRAQQGAAGRHAGLLLALARGEHPGFQSV
ncbi:MAG: 3-deoxy-D-manno-octulosonic acid transferase [Phycisphaerales bacterium JB059]